MESRSKLAKLCSLGRMADRPQGCPGGNRDFDATLPLLLLLRRANNRSKKQSRKSSSVAGSASRTIFLRGWWGRGGGAGSPMVEGCRRHGQVYISRAGCLLRCGGGIAG